MVAQCSSGWVVIVLAGAILCSRFWFPFPAEKAVAFVVLDLSVVRVSRRIRVQFLGSVDVILLWDSVVVGAPLLIRRNSLCIWAWTFFFLSNFYIGVLFSCLALNVSSYFMNHAEYRFFQRFCEISSFLLQSSSHSFNSAFPRCSMYIYDLWCNKVEMTIK